MKMSLLAAGFRRGSLVALVGLLAVTVLPSTASAQYFGRNKVQFDDFDFKILSTDHFDWHYYPEEEEAVMDAVRMGERWYERFARTFQHEFEAPKPVILYADHPDFQQTNTLSGFIGGGTGGVTESLKNRVIMPMTGSYWDTDHVLGHELVHAFQYNIAQSRRGGGLQGMGSLPLWLIEGMAEYLSVGRDDPLTAMWIRDAIRRDELPTIHQMTNEARFFPYRFGQALWAYIGGTYGDDAVVQIYRRALRVGFEGAIQGVLAMPTDTLSERWREAVEDQFLPFMEGRDSPQMAGKPILCPCTGSGSVNISPSLSPDGKYVAFLSEKDLFSVDLYMAETATGRIIRKLSSANSDPHIDALRYIDSSGTWSPDGSLFAYVVVAGGDNQLFIVKVDNGVVQQRIEFEDIGAATNPSWSPDGRYIAISGSVGGISDLFLYDLETEEITQLTDDKYADLQPTWSPDGSTIAFASDRGPETDFERLVYSRFQLTTIDVATGQIEVLPVFGNVKHINPQYSGDGQTLYFISDQDGVSDIYGLSLQTGDVSRHTNVATGISGHTYLSPAMSVAANGTVAFTIFDQLEFHIYTNDVNLPAPRIAAVENAELQPGRRLTPANPDRFSRIATYLSDAETGLMPSGTYAPSDAEEYATGLSLDYVGQPTLGVGTDSYGNYIGGATSAYFSDMLGDKVFGVAVQAQGTFKDIGGQVFYADQSNRWNWIASGGRIPYQFGRRGFGSDEGGNFQGLLRQRIFITSATGSTQYPFSTTERVELSLGLTRYSYDFQLEKFYYNGVGQTVGYVREQQPAPDALNLFRASVALVGDNSFYGFVSPIRGGRYRFSVEQTQGSVEYTTVIGDMRRYYAPHKNLTVAVRALHYGRYGLGEGEQNSDGFGVLNPLFLGFETFIRGYAWESYEASECAQGATAENSCPTLNRLYGNRLAVSSVELRIPFIGVEQYGIINFPFLPTELVAFVDGGLAWDSQSCFRDPRTNQFVCATDDPVLEWSRDSAARVPVVSTGFSARMNVLGFMILETYYAYPWQRPGKGWHWGFNLAPGW
jgi:Tol biopolymer transport system component